MNRFSFVTTILLASLLTTSGCARKTAVTVPVPAIETPQAEVPAGGEDSSGAEVQSEPVAAPSSATLSTLDGRSLETVYFDYNAFTLSAEARQAIARNATRLKANPTVKITVEGHCDERGSDEYNLALGERRALAVKGYLVALGVSENHVTTVSYGEERPAVAGHDESAWAKNRRSEFK